MKKGVFVLFAALGFGPIALTASDSGSWPVREQETIQKTFDLSATPERVVVDNVEGYVHVTGSGGSQVRLTAHKIIRAETNNDLQEARKEISLSFKESPGSLSVLYDAPWRCRDHSEGCDSDHHRRFYDVVYNIDVEVPRDVRLVVSTVNEGDVQVDKTGGPFEVRNVNGAINLNSVAGSGEVNTVNGPVSVHFAKNPSEACAFKTINGSLNIYFPRDVSADLLLKTFNGEVYTDFDVTSRALNTGQVERRDGKFVYRSNRFTAARAGQGGPEFKFETLNGDIRLHRQE